MERLFPADPNTRYETAQWVMWEMGGVRPMFSRIGFQIRRQGRWGQAPERPIRNRISAAARCLNERLAGRDWLMGADYSIADISLLGWVRNPIGFYQAREIVGFDRFLPFFMCRSGSTAASWVRRCTQAGSDGGLERVCSRLNLTWRGAIRERTRTGLAGAKALLRVFRANSTSDNRQADKAGRKQ